MKKLSVVINTYNRADSLANTLESLFYQTYDLFEVIVVNGPSTDNTVDIVNKYRENIKYVECPVRNLSISRNLGIEAASGDIVAFIDDDAIADQNWVRDLVEAYDNEQIGGTGGLVFDNTGMELQYKYSACNRYGDTNFDINYPFDKYNKSNGFEFLYLQGTNCSFRRECLVKINGFDEEIEYYLDEVDVCMRIIDSGYTIKPLDNAIVHHKYMKSFMRNDDKVVLHPYATVKNKFYFALQNCIGNERRRENAMFHLDKWKEEVVSGGNWNFSAGKMTKEELDIYLKEVKDAVRVGIERGKNKRILREIKWCPKEDFLPFKTVKHSNKPLTICFISNEYPPTNFGGIGRYTYDLATTFAKKGNIVHVITNSTNVDTVDFEDGVWVHRITNKMYPEIKDMTLNWNVALQIRNYIEVERINKYTAIDLINGPIWLCETGMLSCCQKYPTVITLMTTQKIINQLNNTDPYKDSHSFKLMSLENATLTKHKYVHAISESILKNCEGSINENAEKFIIPLGCRDLSGFYDKNENKGITILSVGRLEHRKGTDLLLTAAEKILEDNRFSNVHFVFAGKQGDGNTYIEDFQKKWEGREEILSRVVFLGEIDEETLMQNYCDADIMCVPSRYESFGIVLLEAMSFGKAIVAANVGGMKYIINNEENGILFETENVDELTNSLVKLLLDEYLRNKLSTQARKDFSRIYSLDAVYDALYKKYIDIIDHHKVGEGFDCHSYAEIISDAEDISLDDANDIVERLINSIKEKKYLESKVLQMNYSRIHQIIKKIYILVEKINPKVAYKLKNYLAPYYFECKGKGGKCKFYTVIKLIYHLLTKIPIVGGIIKYIVFAITMPYKVVKIYNTLGEKIDRTIDLTNWANIKAEEIKVVLKNQEQLLENQEQLLENIVRKGENEIESLRTKSIEIEQVKNLFDKYKREIAEISYDLYGKNNERLNTIRTELLFELERNIDSVHEKAEVKIINVDKYEEQKRSNNIKINVGAGHICFDDYINIDEREIYKIDIVADVRDLPFEPGSVSEIYAAHIIEHFSRNEFIHQILPSWVSKLRENGKLVIILPDLESMIDNYVNSDYSFEELREVVYGLQEYPGDVHYSLYSIKELEDLLHEQGLDTNVEYKNKRNGKCYEMKIIAVMNK